MKYIIKVPPSKTEQIVEIFVPDLPATVSPIITGTTPLDPVIPPVVVPPVVDASGYQLVYENPFDKETDIRNDESQQAGKGYIKDGAFYSVPDNVSNGTRAEVQFTDAAKNPVEGAIEYDVKYEVIVPNNGCSVQWHPFTPGSSGSPYLMHDGGKFTWVVWDKDGSNDYYATGVTIKQNVYQRFRIEYKFARTGGYLRHYIDGVKVLDKSNIQLGDGSGQYLKIGYNGWDTNSYKSRIYYNNLKVYKKI